MEAGGAWSMRPPTLADFDAVTALLAELGHCALTRQRGCGSVTLESSYHRTASHALYRSAGLQERGLYFYLEL